MLAILTTHPIQYQVPLWQALAKDGRVPFEVWFMTDHGTRASLDKEFGKAFAWDIETLSGYPYRFLDIASGANPASFWKCRLREPLKHRLRQSEATALWIQGWQVAAYWQAVRQGKAAGVDVWLRGESNDLAPVQRWKQPLKRILLGQLFRRVDRFLYIGSANKRLYQNFGVPEERLYPAPYAVDNERFARQAVVLRPQRLQLRRQWGIADDAFCVMFCGKFVPKKRPMDLAAAAQLLRQGGHVSNLHLLFVGSGELGAQLRNACNVIHDAEQGDGVVAPRDRPLRPRASFAGFMNQTEISRAYVAADCLVVASDYGETWGLVANEALASGLPCVVSSACGCAEDLGRSAEATRTYPTGDVERLALLLQSVHRAPHLPSNAADILAHHDFRVTVDTVQQLYRARCGVLANHEN
jgi:glycosyltransferase involved in cell wall biosynthesis